MFLINIYRLVLGYVEIIVSGEFCEKILNLLAIKRVSVWDIHRGEKQIRLKIYIKDFKNMRKIKGKSKLHIEIYKKYGIIFTIKRYFKRIGIPLGVLMFFSTLYFLSLFVWNIAVTGNQSVDTLEIINCCKELGVKNGVLLSKIDSQLLRERLLLKCEDLSWCSFNIEGSKITVNVSEISKNTNENAPTNIVSDYDCIITDIYVESGVANVTKGQAVRRGDLLVSGISDIDSVNKFVKSRAQITAEIRQAVTLNGNFSEEKLVENGEIKEKYVLEFFGVKIPLFLGQIIGDYSEKMTVKNLCFFGEKMPISTYKKSFYMQNKESFNYGRDELLEKLTVEMEDKISKIAEKCEVISRNIIENENNMKLSYEIKYTKNIGLEEKLIFNVSN